MAILSFLWKNLTETSDWPVLIVSRVLQMLGALSLVSTTEELLDRKVAAPV
jgi:hypothetical protein